MKDTRIAKRPVGSTGLWQDGVCDAGLAGLHAGFRHPPVYVTLDPKPSVGLKEQGVQLNVDLPKETGGCACRRQAADEWRRLPRCRLWQRKTVFRQRFCSRTDIADIRENAGEQTPIVRAMPNTTGVPVSQASPRSSANAHVTPKAWTRPKSLLSGRGRCCPVWTKKRRLNAVTRGQRLRVGVCLPHDRGNGRRSASHKGSSPELALSSPTATVARGRGAGPNPHDERPRPSCA